LVLEVLLEFTTLLYQLKEVTLSFLHLLLLVVGVVDIGLSTMVVMVALAVALAVALPVLGVQPHQDKDLLVVTPLEALIMVPAVAAVLVLLAAMAQPVLVALEELGLQLL
jgi:hypothetical protein